MVTNRPESNQNENEHRDGGDEDRPPRAVPLAKGVEIARDLAPESVESTENVLDEGGGDLAADHLQHRQDPAPGVRMHPKKIWCLCSQRIRRK